MAASSAFPPRFGPCLRATRADDPAAVLGYEAAAKDDAARAVIFAGDAHVFAPAVAVDLDAVDLASEFEALEDRMVR
ncbi:hypothetical protein SXCC_04750 [Gluconacetobacter sp. SXCC-1]|nr:hypothetical protein SXCC_04750 [Gluconacetobacter sp. SXCC-1]